MAAIELQKVDRGTPLADALLCFVENFSWLDVKDIVNYGGIDRLYVKELK